MVYVNHNKLGNNNTIAVRRITLDAGNNESGLQKLSEQAAK